MTLRVGKLVYGIIKLLPCLLAVLLASSCSSDVNSDELKGNTTLVTLTIAASGNAATASRTVSGNSSTITRAGVSDSGDKDYYISDLTVLIFDASGDVIGSTTKQASELSPSSDGKITIQVLTRAAKNCTVYAIANALALNDGATPPFAGVATLSALQSKVKTYKDADDINKDSYLLMMGKTADKSFDTTSSGSAAAISLQRLASKIDFNFTVNNDKGTGFPIVVDSYQLCHAPLSAFYAPADMSSTGITLPSGTSFVEYAANSTAFNSWTSGSNSQSYTAYVYANPATTATDATYLLIKAHSQASNTDTRKIWQSEFKVYLNGITGQADYKLLPNYHYSVNITVTGSSQAHHGMIASYKAYPYMAGGSIASWTKEDRPTDM